MLSSAEGGKSTTYQIMMGVNALLLLVALVSGLMFFTGGSSNVDNAFDTGKRLTFNANTGAVIRGNNSTSVQQIEAEKKADEGPDLSSFEVATEEEEQLVQETQATQSEAELAEAELNKIPEYPKTKASLADAPNPDLVELTEWGEIPKTGPTGSPKSYYAHTVNLEGNQMPLLGIAIRGVGLNKAVTEQILTLPNTLSLIYNAYGKHTAKWVKGARNLGFEAWLDIPTQPHDYPASDPGPLGLLTDLPPEDGIARLHQLYAIIPGLVGMTMHGDPFVESLAHIQWVANDLRTRGINFMPAYENPTKNIKSMITKHPAFIATPTSIIDEIPTQAAIDAQLSKLVLEAKRKGKAIGLASAYPLTVETLQAWLPKLQQAGVKLVPVSALYTE
ncbi:MAG: divergent polysaccharide deacetylase family protein [Rickettsiales bacterium]|nr:divergent polysaccharide deacetylase family protein [Rickettsiales bacterium]